MHLIALDTVQITSVQPDPLLAGEPFEVNDVDAKSLIDRGIARAATSDDPKPAEKPDGEGAGPAIIGKPARAPKPKAD